MALKDKQLNTRLQSLSKDQLEEYLALTTRLQELSTSEEGQEKFLKFVKIRNMLRVWIPVKHFLTVEQK